MSINKKLFNFFSFVLFILVLVSGFNYSIFKAKAASTPSLGAAATFGILTGTYTNSTGDTIYGDVGYRIPPSSPPTISGGTKYTAPNATYTQAGTDQGLALTALNGQGCDVSFSEAIDLSTNTVYDVTFHPSLGVFTPGVFCIDGVMSITANLELRGAGTYIFRSTGAFNVVSSAVVTLTSGALASNVFWTPVATTIGTNATFKGTVIDNSGITVGAGVAWTGRALAYAAASGSVTTNTDTITVPTPVLAPVNIVVDNSVQPNKVTLTFSESLEAVQAVVAGNYLVTNNTGTITYSIVEPAVLSNSNKTVTLTLATVAPVTPETFITNAAATTGIKVTPNASNIKDSALNPYAGGEVTAAGAANNLDVTPATVTATLVKNSSTTFTVSFSEKVNKATAENVSNYTLGGTCVATSGNPPVGNAVLQGGAPSYGASVLLTVPDTSACIVSDTVIVTPSATITDVAGVAITSSAATYTFASLAQSGSPELTAGLPPTYDTQLTVGPGTLGVQTNLTYTWYRSADAAIGGDTLLGTGTTYTPVSLDIGNYLIIIATTPDATGDGSLITGATVVKATPTATLAVSNSPQTYSGSGQAANVGITVFSTPGAVANILTGGAATKTNAGTYAVTANFVPTDTANYNTLTALPAGDFIIDKVDTTGSFTVAPSKTYDGGVTVSTLTQVVDDKIGLDDVSLTDGVATYADPNADTGITVSLAGATLTGGAAGNYNLTTVTNKTADITKIQLTHTTPTVTLSKTYDGDTTATITAAGTLSGVFGAEDVTVTEVATYDNKDVGTGKTITVAYTLSGDDQGNYLKPVDDTTTITGVISRSPSTGGGGGGYMRPAFLPSINILSTPVVVTPIIPKLPKTGFPPEEKNTMLPVITLSGLSLVSIFLYFAQKKQTN